MKWGETAHRGGVLNWKNPPPSRQKQSWTCICLSRGKSTFYLGWGCFLGLIRWQHKSVSLGFQSCAWLLGCRMLGEMEGMEYFKTISLLPSPPLPHDRICWKSSENEVDLVFRWLFQGLSSATTGSWGWGMQQAPCPVFKNQHDPLPSLSIISWATVEGVFVGVLQFPSTWVEDHILLEVSLWVSPTHL